MEVDEIQTQGRQQPQQQQHPPPQQQQPPCKYSRVSSNGRIEINGGTHDGPHTEVVGPTAATTATTSTAMMVGNNIQNNIGSSNASSRFGRQWQHSSRIIRVSRASGGKDRHSKVWTAKGPRDRRVRLSVTTAIQFYDLQDRLGYDQPSKAVEWLIKAASEAINELPCLNTASFPPETPPSRQASGEDEQKTSVLDSLADNAEGPQQLQHQQQQLGSKSGCSSNNSETSKGSGGLSLSRSEIRVKARERARERTAKDKEPPSSSFVNVGSHQQQRNVSSMAQTSSFTQLLTAGMSSLSESSKHPRSHGHNNNTTTTNNNNQWLSSGGSSENATQMADYFGTGLIGLGNSNTSSLPQVMTIASFGSENQHHHHHHQNPITHHHHHHPQHHHPHFPFLSDHQNLLQVANAASNGNGGGSGSGGGDYNLNFSISSASSTTSGFNNRGTLQSNSPSLLPYLQRFSDGSSLPFFLGNASAASPNIENHHQHQQQFQPPGLQLCYGDASRQSSDHKGKGKN